MRIKARFTQLGCSPIATSVLIVSCFFSCGAIAASLGPKGSATQTQASGPLGIGQPATESEIKKWNFDVKPNGEGLPAGKGNVADGKVLYEAQCRSCHGLNGIGGPFGSLASNDPKNTFDFGTKPKAVKTIGNYWPYASTVFDYIQRAMPFDTPGSLTANEVYSLVAYLLYENHLIPANKVLNKENLPSIEMPARHRFVVDDRKGGKEIR